MLLNKNIYQLLCILLVSPLSKVSFLLLFIVIAVILSLGNIYHVKYHVYLSIYLSHHVVNFIDLPK